MVLNLNISLFFCKKKEKNELSDEAVSILVILPIDIISYIKQDTVQTIQ